MPLPIVVQAKLLILGLSLILRLSSGTRNCLLACLMQELNRLSLFCLNHLPPPYFLLKIMFSSFMRTCSHCRYSNKSAFVEHHRIKRGQGQILLLLYQEYFKRESCQSSCRRLTVKSELISLNPKPSKKALIPSTLTI